MAQRKSSSSKPTPEPKAVSGPTGVPKPESGPGEEVLAWQRRSIERSLQGARERAQVRGDRFVAAALELLGERDDIDISLQDVVDRSKMSIRTFYAYFDSKESLLLAVYETIMSRMVVPVLRERCDSEPDPVLRVKALLEAILELTAAKAGPVSRALSVFHHRLAETRHDDLDHAMEPLRRLITDLLTDVAAAGHLRDDLDPPTLVALLQEFVLATAHTAVFAGGRPATRLEARWAFCSAAILRHNEPMAGTQPVSDARSTAVHAMQPAFQGPAR